MCAGTTVTGQVTGGRLVGGGIDFTGGFAVIPELSTRLLCTSALAVVLFWCRRRSAGGMTIVQPRTPVSGNESPPKLSSSPSRAP
jgi:hypothetical protein